VKPRLASQIVVSARPRPRGRPRKEEILEPSNAPPVTITDACGTLIAAYDPWTRRRRPAGELPALRAAHARRRARWARKLAPW